MVEKPYATAGSSTKTDQQDAIFETLSNSLRRFSLQHLRSADTPIEVSELTSEIAAWQARQGGADRSGGDADAIEVALVHNHLPKMAEAGVVEYDAARRMVALADRTVGVRPHLEATGSD